MFDYHLHSSVSFDSTASAAEMAERAKQLGLREICFTDHYDFHSDPLQKPNLFKVEAYGAAYDTLLTAGLVIRKGVEFGMTTWNTGELQALLAQREFDFVIGSVHFVDGYDPYEKEYWLDKSLEHAFGRYLEHTLDCVNVHSNFDVLGHLNYICKSEYNPSHEPLFYKNYREICDEIMKVLIKKGKGMEINTSGVDRAGVFLPDAEFLKRYKELGGEIITVGSDAHNAARVGQYVPEALSILKDVFGYVCTFDDRKPIFHKL